METVQVVVGTLLVLVFVGFLVWRHIDTKKTNATLNNPKPKEFPNDFDGVL